MASHKRLAAHKSGCSYQVLLYAALTFIFPVLIFITYLKINTGAVKVKGQVTIQLGYLLDSSPGLGRLDLVGLIYSRFNRRYFLNMK